MLNNLRIAPLNIAPYAQNRFGLSPYADYTDFVVSTQQTIASPKDRPAVRKAFTGLNSNPLKLDSFSKAPTNQPHLTSPARNSTADSATYARQHTTMPKVLKSVGMPARKTLNFMA